MTTMNQLVAQSRTREVARAASHPARLAEHETHLADRGARTTPIGRQVAAACAGLPTAVAWLAALAAALS